MSDLLRAPCAYQGGKQRVAAQIADLLLEAAPDKHSRFYDLCCGSAAVSIELINRGVAPSRIFMLDISSWGTFWYAIGSGTFDMKTFDRFLSALPSDKRNLKAHMSALSALPVGGHEAELYPILQACSFGGKQIWRMEKAGQTPSFGATGSRPRPAYAAVRPIRCNPLQPSCVAGLMPLVRE